VKAKPQHHKFLIGKSGIHIQKIRDETGARIIFPGSNDADKETITIIGTKEACDSAKVIMEAKIKELDNIVEATMTVDPKYHKHFVAKRGEVLRRIGDEFGGVVVSFPRNGVESDKVVLKGAKDCINAAIEKINETVKDLEDQITVDCEIKQSYHRTVMGAKGSKVQKITTDFKVQIKFPDKAVENGEPVVNGDNSCNIIKITGKKENCEKASQALLELVPITAEVSVPFEFHRFIIGQKGNGVREMMNRYDVNIRVPPQDAQSDIICISGVPTNVEAAKEGLAEKVVELEKEKADKALKGYEIQVDVNPDYHPKIIGRSGTVITNLRNVHDVQIQLPKKEAENANIITITGYEKNVNEARDAILKIVGQFESQVHEEVHIDPGVHSMIIGKRGRSIRKIMDDFKVDIRLPRSGDDDPSLVIVSGDDDNVQDCIDHLKILEEEYIQDVADKEWMKQYEKPNRALDNKESGKDSKQGFYVAKAPWDVSSSEAFPSLGGGSGVASKPPTWGPARR